MLRVDQSPKKLNGLIYDLGKPHLDCSLLSSRPALSLPLQNRHRPSLREAAARHQGCHEKKCRQKEVLDDDDGANEEQQPHEEKRAN
jgi:hypothetical protein